MMVFTYSEARQNLSALLDKANQEGEVRIKRRDGQIFVIKPQARSGSPLDVEGVDLNLTLSQILESIQEGRRKE